MGPQAWVQSGGAEMYSSNALKINDNLTSCKTS